MLNIRLDNESSMIKELIFEFSNNFINNCFNSQKELNPYMYFPYKIFDFILNNNRLTKQDFEYLLKTLPEEIYPYIDSTDVEISKLLKNGYSIENAKKEISNKTNLIYYTPSVFLRTYPLLLLSPNNKKRELTEIVNNLISLTHPENVGKIMEYYLLILIEYNNDLVFFADLTEYISNDNMRISYYFTKDDKVDNNILDNEKLIYILLENKTNPEILTNISKSVDYNSLKALKLAYSLQKQNTKCPNSYKKRIKQYIKKFSYV